MFGYLEVQRTIYTSTMQKRMTNSRRVIDATYPSASCTCPSRVYRSPVAVLGDFSTTIFLKHHLPRIPIDIPGPQQ